MRTSSALAPRRMIRRFVAMRLGRMPLRTFHFFGLWRRQCVLFGRTPRGETCPFCRPHEAVNQAVIPDGWRHPQCHIRFAIHQVRDPFRRNKLARPIGVACTIADAIWPIFPIMAWSNAVMGIGAAAGCPSGSACGSQSMPPSSASAAGKCALAVSEAVDPPVVSLQVADGWHAPKHPCAAQRWFGQCQGCAPPQVPTLRARQQESPGPHPGP